MLLSSPVLVPFLGSILAAVMPQNARDREAWLAMAVAAGGLVVAGALFPRIAAGEVVSEEFAWLPAKGLSFVLRVDGLAWVFAMLVLAIRYESEMYFEGAILMVLFGFVGSVALAKFLLRGEVV